MKYLKSFINENWRSFLIRYYERNKKDEDTGFSLLMTYDEREELRKIGLVDYYYLEGEKQYFIRQEDREKIKNKLELLRSAKKYNL